VLRYGVGRGCDRPGELTLVAIEEMEGGGDIRKGDHVPAVLAAWETRITK